VGRSPTAANSRTVASVSSSQRRFPFGRNQRLRNVEVEFALKYAEIFKQDTEKKDCKESESEVCVGSDVPPPKHDTSVDDICIPEMGK